jgi:peptide/nickel transport system substrate-binding protein
LRTLQENLVKTHLPHRMLPVLIATLTLLSGLAGCGGGGNGTSKTPAKPRSATENDINPLSRDRIQDGGKMTWAIDQIPANYNYSELDGTILDGYFIDVALMPMMFMADAGGIPRWNPDYLASEPSLKTDPQESVTYEINPKARWDDGKPITWQDFYWQWKATNGTNKAYKISGSSGYDQVEGVAKGKNDQEVIVTFRTKFSDWQSLFDPLYPASTNESPELFNNGWKARPLVTAGPFKFDSVDLSAKTITLARNEKWWGNPAKLDNIIYRVIDPDAQVDALANGEINYMEIGSDVNKFNRAKNVAAAQLRTASGPNFSHITFNGTGIILSDLNVRRAVAKATDRAAMVRALLGPLGVSTATLGNHLYMANQAGYQDNSGDVGKYDPQAAGRILDQAGWKLEGNVRKKNGQELAITCVIPTAVNTSRQLAELMQNMLAQVGVKLVINTVPGDDFFDKYVTPGQFDVTFFSWFGTPYPISSSKGIYARPTRDAQGQLQIQQNYARIGSEDIDRLFSEATSELDPKKAIQLANQIDVLIWQEVHSLTLYQRPDIWATSKGLANIGAKGFQDLQYQDIGWAKQ